MNLRAQYQIPSLIFLISFLFHLSLISKGPVSVDCLSLAIKSQATLDTHHLQYLYGSGYPLMVLLGSIFITLGKCIGVTDPILAINFISVLFGSMAVLAFYLLLQEICDTLTAILAAFILLLNPIFLDVSTYGINHAPALCFFLFGILSLLRFQTVRNTSSLLLSALYFGSMGATRLQDLILTFPAICFMFVLGLKTSSSENYKPKTRHYLIFIMTIILIIMLFHLPYYLFDQTNYALQAKGNWSLNLTKSFQGLLSHPLKQSLSFLIKAFGIVGIICFTAGLYSTAVFNKRLLTFTCLWWMIPFVLFGNIITSSPRYFNILLPAIIIPISIFLAGMFRHKNMLWKLIAPISCLIVFIQPLVITQSTFTRRHHYALISDYYLWIGSLTGPKATIISCDDEPFITYYSHRNTLRKPVAVVGHLSSEKLMNFKKELDNFLNNGKPVYVTELALIEYDRYEEFREFMQDNYHLIQVGQMPLELWYNSPFDQGFYKWGLFKIEKRTDSIKQS